MKKQKLEFSKKIMIAAFVINTLVIVFSCVMIWRTGDSTPLMYIIPATAAELATGTGFYYNKAKAENKLKIMKEYNIEPTHDDIESVDEIDIQ